MAGRGGDKAGVRDVLQSHRAWSGSSLHAGGDPFDATSSEDLPKQDNRVSR